MNSIENRNSLNRLTIKQLKALAALADQMSITEAARTLGLSQPSLSNRLREIERLTGSTLFHRVNNRLHFNSRGLLLLNSSRLILEELDRAEFYLNQPNTKPQKTLRLESRGYSTHHWIAPFYADLLRESPGVNMEMVIDSNALPLSAVSAGEVDVSIACGDFMKNSLHRQLLFTDELVGIVPIGHCLAEREILSAEDFAEEPFLTYSAIQEKGLDVERLFRPALVVPQRVVCVGPSDAICAFVANGAGLSILSRWAAYQHERTQKVVCKQLTAQPLRVDWFAFTRKSDTADAFTIDFVDRLAGWCKANESTIKGKVGA